MRWTVLILLVIINNVVVNAQKSGCNQFKDTLYLITLDIRAIDKYPVIMSGVTKIGPLLKLNKKNIDSLLADFYENAYYAPDLSNGINEMIVNCMGDSCGHAYINEHIIQQAKLINNLRTPRYRTQFKLKSNETVFYTASRIEGTFWKVEKGNSGVSTSSNEIDIKKLQQIKYCYIPFEIKVYE